MGGGNGGCVAQRGTRHRRRVREWVLVHRSARNTGVDGARGDVQAVPCGGQLYDGRGQRWVHPEAGTKEGTWRGGNVTAVSGGGERSLQCHTHTHTHTCVCVCVRACVNRNGGGVTDENVVQSNPSIDMVH